jgi:hypothetical protein
MEPNEDLSQVLGFELDLLRLITALHSSAGENKLEALQAGELARILERFPTPR